MSDPRDLDKRRSTHPDPRAGGTASVDAFVRKLAAMPAAHAARRGRLVFALDATASREPLWDMASQIQAEMFQAVAATGGLDVQLVFYQGFGRFEAGPWTATAADLLARMERVRCLSGLTQIEKVLRHTLAEAGREPVHALVFVGDTVEETPETLTGLAGQLGLKGVPAFLFQDGDDPVAARVFGDLARLSGGAHCRFDRRSAAQLRELLRAVAVFASGGRRALEDQAGRGGRGAQLLLSHMPSSQR